MDVGSSRTKDFFASPALSLSLAGVFRNAAAVEGGAVEEGEEESGGGGGDALEISSENTGPGQSEEDGEEGSLPEEDEEDDDGEVGGNKKKKRKKYHRHTSEQIREMEALFRESPHPDEKQRQQLSKQLGLAPRQVKFWFQNRRTQIKAIQERHENSLLKSDIEKLREENQCMRETIKKACCPNCGSTTPSKEGAMMTQEQHLRIENMRLKSEIEKLRGMIGKLPHGNTTTATIAPSSSSCSANNNHQETRSSLDYHTGLFGLEKSRISDIATAAMDEVMKMATLNEPLWVKSVETGREILNYDEYIQQFVPESSSSGRAVGRSIEASRETGIVFLDISRLIHAFMDVNQWKDMFPGIISKAAVIDVIASGEGSSKNGAMQLMFAELQLLTPMVSTREVYFVRYCKQQSPEKWAIIDVSVDKVEDNIDVALIKCRKRPSGCIIEDTANGHSKVTWVEHMESQRSTTHTMFRSIINTGLPFGAQHWIATLQQQCERQVFFMATNVPTKDSSGVSTLAGRKSVLTLAQRMTCSFCHAIGGSSYHTWTKVSTKCGDDMRISSRKNLNDPGEPVGLILCAVSSIWLPVASIALFGFLRDDSRRKEWDVMFINGGESMNTIANLAKGQDRGNSVTLHAEESNERSNNTWLLQDCCTNGFESTVVFTPVDISAMQPVMTGCDSSKVAVLPSGFSILPDGMETRPQVITSRQEGRSMEGGSLFTVAVQILANASPAAKLTVESVESLETASALVSRMLQNIKKAMKCEDG